MQSGKWGYPLWYWMERAALAVADEMENGMESFQGRGSLVFCGTGNNGADGSGAG